MPQWKELSRNAVIDMYTASGATTPLETTVLDMNGFESVIFLGLSSVTNTGNQLAVLNGTASTTGAGNFSEVFSPVGASAVTSGIYADVYRPTKRFIQGNWEASGASAPARALVAIRYGARSVPTTQPAGTTGVRMYSPGSGTATATG